MLRAVPTAAVVTLALLVASCSGDDDGDLVAFCERLREVPVITSKEQIDSAGPDADVLAGVVRRLANVEEVAPGDVADDVHTMVETVAVLHDAIEAEGDLGGEGAAAAEARAEVETRRAAYAMASDRVVDYAEASCGIELEPSG
ncbi:MAG: hypothetical protein S0880_30720 [Actinomycetota bacterium]|nr:hypothetical protein [Actinomycetota bacterium]